MARPNWRGVTAERAGIFQRFPEIVAAMPHLPDGRETQAFEWLEEILTAWDMRRPLAEIDPIGDHRAELASLATKCADIVAYLTTREDPRLASSLEDDPFEIVRAGNKNPTAALELASDISRLSANFRKLANSNRSLREHRRWIGAATEARNPERDGIWFPAYRAWVSLYAAPPGMTADGPFHRFISAIHRVFGISAPRWPTLRDAIKEWKQDGAT